MDFFKHKTQILSLITLIRTKFKLELFIYERTKTMTQIICVK